MDSLLEIVIFTVKFVVVVNESASDGASTMLPGDVLVHLTMIAKP